MVRTDLPGAAPVARRAGRTARRTRLRQRLRLGLHHPRRPELRRSRAGRQPVLLPARLPPDRGRAAPPRLRSRGRRGRARATTAGDVRPRGAADDQPGGARRRAAGRAAPARRVRRAAAPQLPDADDRDPRLYRTTFNGPAATLLAAGPRGLLPAPAGPRAARSGAAADGRGWVQGSAGPPTRLHLGGRGLAGRGRTRRPGGARPGRAAASLARWLVRGTSTTFPAGDISGAALDHPRPGGRRRGASPPLRRCRSPGSPSATAGPLATAVERSVYPANALPGIVVALALVTISIRVVPGDLPDAAPAGARLLHLVPAARRGERPRDPRAGPAGARRRRALARLHGAAAAARRVTLPLVLPGLGASMALVSLAVSTELTATLLLAPIGTSTLATEFWSRASAVEYGAAAPYALLLIALSVPATWLLSRAANRDGLRSPRECRPGRPRDERPARDRAAKAFGSTAVLDVARPRRSATASPRCSGPRAAARPRCCAWSRASSTPTPAPSRSATGSSPATGGRCRRARAGSGYVPQEGALFPHLDVTAQRRLRAARAPPAAAPGSARCSTWWSSRRRSPSATRTSSPAVSSSAWRSPARWPPSPALVLLDEPFSSLDAGLREDDRSRRRPGAARERRHGRARHPRPGRGAVAGRPGGGDAAGRSSRSRRPPESTCAGLAGGGGVRRSRDAAARHRRPDGMATCDLGRVSLLTTSPVRCSSRSAPSR